MSLSEEERKRIEEEERVRAEARVRAEGEVRRKLADEEARKAAEQQKRGYNKIGKGFLGCLGLPFSSLQKSESEVPTLGLHEARRATLGLSDHPRAEPFAAVLRLLGQVVVRTGEPSVPLLCIWGEVLKTNGRKGLLPAVSGLRRRSTAAAWSPARS
jgi:hypothetical protein